MTQQPYKPGIGKHWRRDNGVEVITFCDSEWLENAIGMSWFLTGRYDIEGRESPLDLIAPYEVPASQEQKTLRDEFAMAALTGILANPETDISYASTYVNHAYQVADAMLEARKCK